MTRRRLPGTLVGGRVRTSTVLLLVAFVGVLTLWVSVRPTTAETTEEVLVRHTTKSTSQDTDFSDQPRRTVPPRPSVTPTPTPTPLVAPVGKGKGATTAPLAPASSSGPAPLPVAPPAGDTPGKSSASPGSLGHLIGPGQAPPPSDAPAEPPPPG
jgi:hypothetical protein